MGDADRLRAAIEPPTGRLDETAMAAWGRAVGAALPRPALVALSGPLGAGKTTLARALATGAGVPDAREVTSPTYAIVHEHAAPGGLAHVDLYRLPDADAVLAAGWDGVLERNALVLVEWPERAEALLPRPYVHIHLEYPASPAGDATARMILAEVRE